MAWPHAVVGKGMAGKTAGVDLLSAQRIGRSRCRCNRAKRERTGKHHPLRGHDTKADGTGI